MSPTWRSNIYPCRRAPRAPPASWHDSSVGEVHPFEGESQCTGRTFPFLEHESWLASTISEETGASSVKTVKVSTSDTPPLSPMSPWNTCSMQVSEPLLAMSPKART